MPGMLLLSRSLPASPRGVAACCAALLLVGCLSAAPCRAGVLEGMRTDVRTDDPDPPKRERRRERRKDHHDDHDGDGHSFFYFESGGDVACHDDHCGGCDDDDDPLGELCGIAALWILSSPYWAPHGALGDDFAVPMYFEDFPYADGPGALCRAPGRFWSGRLRADYADNFDDLSRISGHLLLTTSERFGLDTEASRWEERLPDGGTDRLWVGDANIVFRFAQCEQMQFRSGLGFNWFEDRADIDYGFNFTYGLDYFPRRPWVLSATLDLGRVGTTGLTHFRATAGLIVNRVEVYTGYDYLAIGSEEINTLVSGLRVWF